MSRAALITAWRSSRFVAAVRAVCAGSASARALCAPVRWVARVQPPFLTGPRGSSSALSADKAVALATDSRVIRAIATLVDRAWAAPGSAALMAAFRPVAALGLDTRVRACAVALLSAVIVHTATLAALAVEGGALGWVLRAVLGAAALGVALKPRAIARAWCERNRSWR